MDEEESWLSWWRGYTLSPNHPRWQPPEGPDESTEIAMILSHWLDEIATQAELLEILRQCKNPITDTFAALLGAEGKDGWKLTLTKSGRGPLTGRRGGEAHYVMSCYDEALEKYSGHRKRVQLAELEIADQFNMTQDAARSFVRRVKGTHSKPRKRKGRK